MFSRLRKGMGKSWEYNMLHGKYKVLYPDNYKSHNMCYDVARNYAKIFNGKVMSI